MHPDGGGLYLLVGIGGAKSWIYRFMLNRRERQMGLGSLSAVTLAQARQKAAECRSQRAAGADPIQAREALRAATRQVMTFQEAATAYIASHSASWRNERHKQQWPKTMETYVFPLIGDLPVAAVDTESVLKVLKPLWSDKPETASRIRGRIESVLGWAKSRGHRTGDNPALWRDHLSHSLPPPAKVRRVAHHPAMPYRDLPAFMAALGVREGIAAAALQFTILTATRTGEVLGASWDEIDLAGKMWVIPRERMKAGVEHRIPLVGPTLAVVDRMLALKRSDFVFPGQRPGRPLHHDAMAELLAQMKRDTVTVHGFRSSFRDWAGETTNHANHVIEMALAHATRASKPHTAVATYSTSGVR